MIDWFIIFYKNYELFGPNRAVEVLRRDYHDKLKNGYFIHLTEISYIDDNTGYLIGYLCKQIGFTDTEYIKLDQLDITITVYNNKEIIFNRSKTDFINLIKYHLGKYISNNISISNLINYLPRNWKIIVCL